MKKVYNYIIQLFQLTEGLKCCVKGICKNNKPNKCSN